MMEIIFMLAATAVVFSLFLGVYFIKDRRDSDARQRPACAHCDCHGSHPQYDRFLRHSKQIQKDIRPCSKSRALK